MKREKEQRNPLLKGQRLNTISVICLILLMFCYLAMTAASTVQMAKQTDIISNHPFEVVISAGDVKLYVSEMGLRTERLTRHYGSEDIERVTAGTYTCRFCHFDASDGYCTAGFSAYAAAAAKGACLPQPTV